MTGSRGRAGPPERRDRVEPGDRVDRPSRVDDEAAPRKMERLADLLPDAARQLGLEEQLEQARLAQAWDRVLVERVPAAVGSCRLVGYRQDVATIEVDQPIVAQEIRLRLPELLGALRHASRVPVRQLRLISRHV